jgi:hypothetical protein
MEYDIDTDSDIEYEIEAATTAATIIDSSDENAFPINQAEALKILNAPVTRPPLNAARWHPVVEIRRKMVQDGKIAEDDAIDFSDLEYAQTRLAIVRNPYSLATDAAQYTRLCPFESASASISTYTPPKDVDAFRLFQNSEIQCHRLVAGHDRVKQTGWLIVNEPLSTDPDALIRFDAAGYLDQLADMDEGDAVLLAVNNRAAPLKAKVAEKRAGSHMFLQHGKTRYRYELKHVERNKFMVWPASATSNKNIITKDVFFRRNVLLTGSDTRPAHVTGDDVLALLKPVAYEAVQKAYPMIDDAVFFKSSWQKNLETQVAAPAPAPAPQNKKKHPKTNSTWRKMLDLNRRQLDDVALVKSILSHGAAPKRVIGPSASAQKATALPANSLVFHSVRESLAAPCGNKKVAYLVLAMDEFRYDIKKKTCIFPLEYQIFRLEPTKIPDGKTVWLKTANVTDQFIRPLPLAPEPFDTIPDPARYAQLRTPVALEPPLPALTFNGTRSYAHFRGGHETRREETVVEFDDLVAMQEADETKGAAQEEEENAPPPSTFIERLAHAASVTLHPGQIAFIDKCLTNERHGKNFKGAMENMLRCFSIFVILAQISLPRLIIADVGVQTVKTSFPMGPLGNFGLVEHMVAVMNKLVKAEFGADANPKTQEWMVGSIKALLKSKPILQMQLEKQGQAQDQVQATLLFVPAWKPLVMRRVYIDHLVKLERETAPLQAAERFKGMANKAARTATTGLYIARRLPRTALVPAPSSTIRQFNMRLAPLNAPPPSPPDLAAWIAGMLKKNAALRPALAPLATATKNQDLWNELSAQIVQMPGPEFVKKLIMTKTQKNKNKNITNILIEFIAFDLKDLLARFAFNYTGPEGFRHLEQIKKMHAVGGGVQQQVMSVLNDCIAGFDVFTIAPPDDDLIYVLVYVLLTALERLDPSTVAYLAAGLETKIALNTTTVATAREGYEIVRERRKTRIMAAYGDMDRDLRRAIKNAVTSGLTSNDAVVAKSERDRENMAAVADSARDDHDANAAEE